MVTVYYNKRIKITISKGQVHRAESKREESELPGVLTQKSPTGGA